ncbi:hypothetical protein RY831_30865 [Noviherbaspirillum sp. CPCC 100848]|uniref:DUF4258 domain-containing protein n=1 Tax=Noviherbaspirillum album TaxID=3080276 RepID=A0ABU6JIM2_9BURK|nr:hypothetical protein [Noviherbaspirillum sp. CPCC 100848]MEC4723545.1 hypothetical protein [Noviherbaspirillum sp. CPCC 100848]
MKITCHAQLRQQQRGIPRLIIDLLLDFGAAKRSGEGATTHYFDKRSRRKLQAYAGKVAPLLAEYLDYYAVVNSDGSVITVAPRIKKVRH